MSADLKEEDMELFYQKLSYQNALSLRACPPDPILFGDKTPLLEKHIRGCNLCQENLGDQSKVLTWKWPDFPAGFQNQSFEPGQVRRINADLAGWGPKNRYYNPPLVILLERIDHHASHVAQIYPGDDFIGPLDVNIDGLGYVQSWNTYTMSHIDLEAPLETHHEVAAKVLERSRQDFTDLPQGYFHNFFYALEIELGSFFSQLSLARILNRSKAANLASPENFQELLNRNGVVLPLKAKVDIRFEVARMSADVYNAGGLTSLFPARGSDVSTKEESLQPPLRMAAADRRQSKANVLLQRDSGLFLDTVFYTITALTSEPENRLLIAGKFESRDYWIEEMMAWWETDSVYTPVFDQKLSIDRRFFELVFDGITREMAQQGHLVLLLSALAE